MDHQDLRRAQSSGQEGHHVCSKCGWPFPNPHPSARHRRAHKKICGRVEGYKVAASAQQSLSDDDQHSDDDLKTPSPKVLERSVYEKGSGGIGQGSIQSDDGVFADAVAEFSDGGSAARTEEGLEDAPESVPIVERGAEKDLSAVPFHNDGETTVTYASEDLKKINVTDSKIESCLTSVDQEAEVTGITATDLDRKISTETTSISDDKTEKSKGLLRDTNGLHPITQEMVTGGSEFIEKTGETDNMIDSCLTTVDQEAEVGGITATILDTNMILPNKVAGETVEGGSKFEGSSELTSEYVQDDEAIPSDKDHTDGLDVHFPPADVPPEVESVGHVNTSLDTAEMEVNNTDGIQFLNSGKVIKSHDGEKEEKASVHVLSVPDDLHVVEDPVVMLEDFKDHKGKQLDRFTSCLDSWEQFEDEENNVKQPIFNENLNILQSSDLSGGSFTSPDVHNLEASLKPDDGSSKPMIKNAPDEVEANMSQPEIKMLKETDEIGASTDAVMPLTANNHVDEFPEEHESHDKSKESLQVNFSASDAGTDQTTLSVGLDDSKKDENCDGREESGDDSKKGYREENLLEIPIATVQSANGNENQSYPASNLQKGDDAVDNEDGVIGKCNKFGDAGYNEMAETFNLGEDETRKEAPEKSSKDPASDLETVSCLSEPQVNRATILHEGGDADGNCENGKTGKYEFAGYDVDLDKADKCASFGEDSNERCTDKTFAKELTTRSESVNESQVHLAKRLAYVDGSADHDNGKVEKSAISENESMGKSLQENILVKSDLTPESSIILAKTVVEDVTNGSGMEPAETSGRDLDISSNSGIAEKILSDAQHDVIENEIACSDNFQKGVDAGVAAGSDYGQDVVSSEKSLDVCGEKEPGFSALDTKSSVQSFIASQDSGTQEVHAVASGITSQSLLEEGDNNLVRQQPSPTAIDVDSNSQTDSLEANWGSFSVLSMQSDVEVVPLSHSQPSLEENSDLKKSKAECESPYSDRSSDMFEAPSFMTLVEPRGADDKTATDSETPTAAQNPEQPKPASLQTGWFPSMTHVVNESEGRKKNEEIITKVTNWSSGKQHTPLKNLLGEASSESKEKPLNEKESQAPAPQKDDKAAKVSGPVTTVNSILNPESPTDEAAKKEHAKEWNSPARYPSEAKSEKKKVKGRSSWVHFVCCASVKPVS